MQKILNLPKFVAIPLSLIILAISAVFFSFLFAILLIPISIMAYRFWKKMPLTQTTNDANVIEAEYTVLDKNSDK